MAREFEMYHTETVNRNRVASYTMRLYYEASGTIIKYIIRIKYRVNRRQ